MDLRNILTLLGVVLLGLPAAPALANEPPTLVWAGCGITRTAFMAELAEAYEKKTGVKVDLQGGGATKGIREGAKGGLNIGGACRVALQDHEEERFAKEVPVAWDALAVIVHKDNPVSNISFRQLRDLYLGKITNWNQLGGPDAPIELYVRRGKISGVGRTLRELVFANYDQEFVATHVVASTGPLERAIEQNRYGIGTTGISSARRRDVKVLQLGGFDPSYENIKSGEYVLYRPLYMVVKQGDRNPVLDDFIKFAHSAEGKEIIRRAGTVPYGDAMNLVMKQVEQYQRASEAGL